MTDHPKRPAHRPPMPPGEARSLRIYWRVTPELRALIDAKRGSSAISDWLEALARNAPMPD